MRVRIAIVLLALVCATFPPAGARAGLTAAEIAETGVAPPADARVPLDLSVPVAGPAVSTTLRKALGGKPGVLIFADFSCTELCNPVIAQTGAALANQRNTRLAVVGLDPRNDAPEARAFVSDALADPALFSRTTVFLPTAGVRDRLAATVGFRFTFDKDRQRYAHPAAAFVLDSEGRLGRVLSPFTLDEDSMNAALAKAADGAGELAPIDRLILSCYGFAAASGPYTLLISRALAVLSVLTVVGLFGGIGWLIVRERRVRPS